MRIQNVSKENAKEIIIYLFDFAKYQSFGLSFKNLDRRSFPYYILKFGNVKNHFHIFFSGLNH